MNLATVAEAVAACLLHFIFEFTVVELIYTVIYRWLWYHGKIHYKWQRLNNVYNDTNHKEKKY